MASFPFSVALVILTLLCLSMEAAATEYIYHFCSDTATFTPNSTYQSNLYQLFSSLSSNSTRQDGFYNNTVGRNASDSVYGLFLCRGDLTVKDCQDCVASATQDLTQKYCPVAQEAIIYYEECMLRYSYRYFFSNMITAPSINEPNRHNISDPVRFNQLLTETMSGLITQVANDGTSDKKFATKAASFTGSQILYTLEQCTPDISSSDCSTCIQTAIALQSKCCGGLQGVRVMLPSCRIRYEMYQFYRTLNIAPTPTPIPAILPPSPSPVSQNSGKRKLSSLGIILSIVAATVVLLVVGFYLLRRARTAVQYQIAANDVSTMEKLDDSLQFDLATIEAATNNFLEDNKLGTGGFGEVYKGVLPNGEEIAVKRLSRSSRQGNEEFKNEIVLVAKLQHRNLVRLLGFCFEGEEKILVYEFVRNKSLDKFIYDPEKQRLLDWATRYNIIGGIARGILYLHEDSRLKIIHRDLKASNILLDEDMNPKIADFGISKIFEVDQTQGNTSRIIGTYGYMAPEYATYGRFSAKSDVYSFGVLVFEILSGKKNNSFYQTENAEDLSSYAWKLWKDGRPLELLDPSLGDSYSSNEVMRCIHIGLSCVQENPADRPTMTSILLMLNSYSMTLQVPQEPASVLKRRVEPSMPINEPEPNQPSSNSMQWSVNGQTITELDPR